MNDGWYGAVRVTGIEEFHLTGSDQNNDLLVMTEFGGSANGGGGNDTFLSLKGADKFVGGDGQDLYYFVGNFGIDLIEDLTTGDIVDFRGLMASDLSFRRVGADLIVESIAGDRLTLTNHFDGALTGRAWQFRVDGVVIGVNVATLPESARGTLMRGTSNADQLVGSASADEIVGLAGADLVRGDAGADFLRGGTGDDVYAYSRGDGSDTISDDSGDDMLLLADAGALNSAIRIGNDLQITASDGARILIQNHFGVGRIERFSDLDSATFGVSASDGSIGLLVAGSNLTESLTGAAGNDLLLAWDGADKLQGEGGADTLSGGAGSDTLDGGAGIDRLIGGAGDDAYFHTTGDVVIEGLNQGIDTVRTDAATHVLALNVENVVAIGTGARSFVGNALNNAISGNVGSDTLNGGAGNDTLDGSNGIDRLIGGLGDDVYLTSAGDVVVEFLNQGIDEVRTTSATFVLGVNIENLTATNAIAHTLTGNTLNNAITGNGGADTLNGGAGNDTLVGGAGIDRLVGGADNDTYVVETVGDLVVEFAGAGIDTVRTTLASYTLTANVENLVATNAIAHILTGNTLANSITGNGAADSLLGGDGADTLTGGAGADTLVGGAGIDRLVGGADNDTYAVETVGDLVVEFAGAGVDSVRTTLAAYTLTLNVENLVATNAIAHTLVGNALANSITGNSSADSLLGGDGTDTLNGGTGADTLVGGAGVDRLVGGADNDTYAVETVGDLVVEFAGAGVDTVRTTLAAYTLTLNVENLVATNAIAHTLVGNALANSITGNSSADSLLGGDGTDTLNGGTGADTLVGGAGVDRLIGGADNDTYLLETVGDLVVEFAGAGVDTVRTTLAAYTLTLNVENLVATNAIAHTLVGNALANNITGNSAADSLLGGDGADTLTGGAGADTLIGDVGQDTLTGGAGNDQFRINAIAESTVAAPDLILDFSFAAATGIDRVDLRAIDANAGLAGDQAFTYRGANFAGAAGDLRVQALGGGVFVAAGDVNGDSVADFAITIQSATGPGAGWFLL
ncbi:beta strand repeat-containing protein [Neoroseomonas soli]|uniref:beta strand repeat-containing protein n=1 Tax=Neoroseomonas soli TaxID=1081025 RepID=UPI001BA82DCA